jgi:hypothetical protein
VRVDEARGDRQSARVDAERPRFGALGDLGGRADRFDDAVARKERAVRNDRELSGLVADARARDRRASAARSRAR